MIRELDCVVLTVDPPESGLGQGALGAVVFVHEDGHHFEVEFVSPTGETLALSTLKSDQIRRVAFYGEASERSESRDASAGKSPSP